MKILSLITTALMLTASLFGANTTAYSVSEKSVTIYVADWKANDINVSIVDSDGNRLYSETLAKGAVTRSYNLKRLPLGSYTIVTENDLRIEKQGVTVLRGAIELSNTDTASYYKPYFSSSEDIVNINYLAQNRKVSITVSDAEGVTLHSERLQEVSIKRSLDLSTLPVGSYTVTVTDNIQRSSYTLVK